MPGKRAGRWLTCLALCCFGTTFIIHPPEWLWSDDSDVTIPVGPPPRIPRSLSHGAKPPSRSKTPNPEITESGTPSPWRTATRSPLPSPTCHNGKERPMVLREECTPNELIAVDECRNHDPYGITNTRGSAMADVDHLVVFSRGLATTNLTWVTETIAHKMPYLVYDKTHMEPAENVAKRTVQMDRRLDRANEHTSMLLYILNYYDCLPRVTIFLHGHQNEPHNKEYCKGLGNVTANMDADFPELLSKVCWDKVRGYYAFNSLVLTLDHLHQSFEPTRIEWEAWMPDVAENFPDPVIFHCCTSFMIHRDTIRNRPKSWYLSFMQYLAEDNPNSGRNLAYIIEWSWEYIFRATDALTELAEYSRCVLDNRFDCDNPKPFPSGVYQHPSEIFGC